MCDTLGIDWRQQFISRSLETLAREAQLCVCTKRDLLAKELRESTSFYSEIETPMRRSRLEQVRHPYKYEFPPQRRSITS